jgi:hypothetical protein
MGEECNPDQQRRERREHRGQIRIFTTEDTKVTEAGREGASGSGIRTVSGCPETDPDFTKGNAKRTNPREGGKVWVFRI